MTAQLYLLFSFRQLFELPTEGRFEIDGWKRVLSHLPIVTVRSKLKFVVLFAVYQSRI